MDNTATVAYINHQVGVRSHRITARPPSPSLEPAETQVFASHLHYLNHAADSLLQQVTLWDIWRLLFQMVQLIWSRFDQAQIDLCASQESSHFPLWYCLTMAPLGIDTLVYSWLRDLCKYAFPPVSLIAQTLCKVREDMEQVLMVAPYWPNQT